MLNTIDDQPETQDTAPEPIQGYPGATTCINDPHPRPNRMYLPDTNTVLAHDWINEQLPKHQTHRQHLGHLLAAQNPIALALDRICEGFNQRTCPPACQHRKAIEERILMDKLMAATRKMELAERKCITALTDIKQYLSLRILRQKPFNTPFHYGPLPIPQPEPTLEPTFPTEPADDFLDFLSDSSN